VRTDFAECKRYTKQAREAHIYRRKQSSTAAQRIKEHLQSTWSSKEPFTKRCNPTTNSFCESAPEFSTSRAPKMQSNSVVSWVYNQWVGVGVRTQEGREGRERVGEIERVGENQRERERRREEERNWEGIMQR
jgi:hypothetical protein